MQASKWTYDCENGKGEDGGGQRDDLAADAEGGDAAAEGVQVQETHDGGGGAT